MKRDLTITVIILINIIITSALEELTSMKEDGEEGEEEGLMEVAASRLRSCLLITKLGNHRLDIRLLLFCQIICLLEGIPKVAVAVVEFLFLKVKIKMLSRKAKIKAQIQIQIRVRGKARVPTRVPVQVSHHLSLIRHDPISKMIMKIQFLIDGFGRLLSNDS